MFFVVLEYPKVSGYATFTMPFQKTYLLNPMFRYHVATNIALQIRGQWEYYRHLNLFENNLENNLRIIEKNFSGIKYAFQGMKCTCENVGTV